MPNRTTRDYEGPSVAPRIQAVIDQALEDEGDIDIDDRSRSLPFLIIFLINVICFTVSEITFAAHLTAAT